MKYLILILMLIVMGCHSRKDNLTLIQNKSGQDVKWEKSSFPIKFQFNFDVPDCARVMIKTEAQKLNRLMEMKVIEFSDTDFKATKFTEGRIGHNVIYWGNLNGTIKYDPSFQAVTSVYWMGNSMVEVGMKFNAAFMENFDKASIIRHEMGHALGMRHLDHGLMRPNQTQGEIKEWNLSLINSWKTDMNIEVSSKYLASKLQE
jgi:hypothetical protein